MAQISTFKAEQRLLNISWLVVHDTAAHRGTVNAKCTLLFEVSAGKSYTTVIICHQMV